ncbi:MAG: hypothetical protein AAGD35_07665 [Actinomycetota bacterium]
MNRWVLTNGEELFVAGSYFQPDVQVRLYAWLIEAVASDPWSIGTVDDYSSRSARLTWLDDVLVVLGLDDAARTMDVLSIEVLVAQQGLA